MILALDPGKTVGWAAFTEPNTYKSGQFPLEDTMNFLRTAWLSERLTAQIANQEPSLKLVVEKFILRKMPNVDLSAVECIGVINAWATQGNFPITWQRPHQAKFFYTNERLKDMGLYKPSNPHAMDAMRHLLRYIDKEARLVT